MDEVDLKSIRIDPKWAFKIPPAIALRRMALALGVIDGSLAVAMADPADARAAEAIAAACGMPVRPLAADKQRLREELLRVYGDARGSQAGADSRSDPVAAVDRILRAAALRQASDIHFCPVRDGLEVRMRIDGVIEPFCKLPAEMAPAATSRIKVLAGLDIAEKRAPQDGGFAWDAAKLGAGNSAIDIRAATLPVRHGERITLRLLESGRERLTMDSLGLSESEKRRFKTVLSNPHGLVLLTGPTGSGKTTTLYAAIRELLSRGPVNILTVEDPVEYEIDGVSQAEVDAGDKVNFARALRSLLRHDPDVVMIGEIRDETSLDTALKAALTGHLVLSTLHTNDAVGAVTRLRDMGVENHLIAATMRLGAAQRLVRRLCPQCRAQADVSAAEAAALGSPALGGRAAWRPTGCLACAGRGYSGRTGIFEFMLFDSETASLVSSGADEAAVRAHRASKGEKSLFDAACEKLLSGETDAGELIKAFGGA